MVRFAMVWIHIEPAMCSQEGSVTQPDVKVQLRPKERNLLHIMLLILYARVIVDYLILAYHQTRFQQLKEVSYITKQSLIFCAMVLIQEEGHTLWDLKDIQETSVTQPNAKLNVFKMTNVQLQRLLNGLVIAMDILNILGHADQQQEIIEVIKFTRLLKPLTKWNTTNMPTSKELFLLMKWVRNAE